MSVATRTTGPISHPHRFLGEGHEQSERKAWAVIWLCGAMMCAEIVGGLLFGSIALVADDQRLCRGFSGIGSPNAPGPNTGERLS